MKLIKFQLSTKLWKLSHHKTFSLVHSIEWNLTWKVNDFIYEITSNKELNHCIFWKKAKWLFMVLQTQHSQCLLCSKHSWISSLHLFQDSQVHSSNTCAKSKRFNVNIEIVKSLFGLWIGLFEHFYWHKHLWGCFVEFMKTAYDMSINCFQLIFISSSEQLMKIVYS